MEAVPHAAHAVYYANIVRDSWLQRQLIDACTDIAPRGLSLADDTEDVLSRAEQRIFEILEEQAGTTPTIAIGDILQDTFDRIFERMDQEGTISAACTPAFTVSTTRPAAFSRRNCSILAARPSMGKTALVCNFALAAARAEQRGADLQSRTVASSNWPSGSCASAARSTVTSCARGTSTKSSSTR